MSDKVSLRLHSEFQASQSYMRLSQKRKKRRERGREGKKERRGERRKRKKETKLNKRLEMVQWSRELDALREEPVSVPRPQVSGTRKGFFCSS